MTHNIMMHGLIVMMQKITETPTPGHILADYLITRMSFKNLKQKVPGGVFFSVF